jgi:hypothetical protein
VPGPEGPNLAQQALGIGRGIEGSSSGVPSSRWISRGPVALPPSPRTAAHTDADILAK